jgi:glycosyltransferase involved in cell wall biosynthesis
MNLGFVEDNYLLWERTDSFRTSGVTKEFMLTKWESTTDLYAGALTRLGHRCVKFVPSLKDKGVETFSHALGFKVVKVPCGGGGRPSLLSRLDWRLSARTFTKKIDGKELAGRCDLVHYHSYYSSFFLASTSLKGPKRRTVQYTGGEFPQEMRKPQRTAALFLLKRALRTCDGVLLDEQDPESARQKSFLMEVIGLPAGKIHPFATIMVDESVFRERKNSDARAQLGIDRRAFVILAVSSVMEEPPADEKLSKNPFLLVRLFAKLVEETQEDVQLHLVGGGAGLNSLRALVKRLGLEKKVVFHGIVPHGLVPVYISASDLVFIPYHFYDLTFGTAVMEAFACGRPVAGFKRFETTPTECVGGFLIDEGDGGAMQLSRIIADGDALRKKAVEGKKVAQGHGAETLGRQLESTFEEILGGPR